MTVCRSSQDLGDETAAEIDKPGSAEQQTGARSPVGIAETSDAWRCPEIVPCLAGPDGRIEICLTPASRQGIRAGRGHLLKEIRIHGRGGQGAVLAAELLVVAAFSDKKYGQAFPAFGGERRGAPVQAFIRLDTRPIGLRHRVNTPDWILILDPSLLDTADVLQGLAPDGLVLINSERAPSALAWSSEALVCSIPATRIAMDILGQPHVNPAMLGAFAAATGAVSLQSVQEAFRRRFPGDLGEKNSRAAQTAFDWFNQTRPAPERVGRSRQVIDLPAWGDSPGLGAPGRSVHFAAVIGPRTALTYSTGTWRYNRPVFDHEKCNGCGFCEMYCPDSCVLVEGKKYSPDYEYCKGCGICARECPTGAITIVPEEG